MDRMHYPAQAGHETHRGRRRRLALQASVAREARHAERFGARPAPEPVAPIAVLKPSGELVMTFDAFRGGDHVQVCHFLGLKPPPGPRIVGGQPEAPPRRRRKGRR